MRLDRAECLQLAAYGKHESGTTAEQSFACPLPGKCGAGPWTVSPRTRRIAERHLLLTQHGRSCSALFASPSDIERLLCSAQNTPACLRLHTPRTQDYRASSRMRWPTGGSAISPASAALLLLGAIPRAEAAYSLQTLYQGESFFNGWSFWGNRDNLTNGTANSSFSVTITPPLCFLVI
jgi:hypothetical protein